ncbi:MAG: synthase subunit delta [Candidatus Midichloriaceae bacterium]|jgi:F-type H+-transporting ATPase subunit delta|nr:synthase subunit delta [Candidatus Midichloriaceae bacterium]
MKDHSILVDRYTRSLHHVAIQQNCAGAVHESMPKIFENLDSFGEYKNLALSQQVPSKTKSVIWGAILDALKVDPVTRAFIQLLISNRRSHLLPKIAIKLRELKLEQEGIKPAIIYTSFKLSESEQKAIKKDLEKIYGQQIELSNYVDEGILGGMILHVEPFMLDASLKSKLSKIKQTLLS